MATAPGRVFCPPDHELTDVYLQRELAGHPAPLTLDFVHHLDIYTADPEHLVEKRAQAPGTGKGEKHPVWYFVSPTRSAAGGSKRKARAVTGGTWHEESNKAVKGSALGGFVKTFTYLKKTSSGKERLGWIMKEFDISPQNGGGHRVLCKIYRTPRKMKAASTASSASSSSATTSSSSSGGCRKRKAASDHPDAPTPSVPRTYDEPKNHSMEKSGPVFMEGSGESEHYDAAAYSYVPGGETMEFPLSTQESFLPWPEVYGTAPHMQGGYIDLDELLNLSTNSDYQPSEEEIQAKMLELMS